MCYSGLLAYTYTSVLIRAGQKRIDIFHFFSYQEFYSKKSLSGMNITLIFILAVTYLAETNVTDHPLQESILTYRFLPTDCNEPATY